MSLEKLLRPKSYAIVGASEKPGSFGAGAVINALQTEALSDIRVYLINPKNDKIMGRKTYKSLSDLPEVVDLVMIATPNRAVPAILNEAGELGIKAAIIVAAGYSEEGTKVGLAAEVEIREIVNKYNMIVLGPNTLGYVNNVIKLKAWALCNMENDLKNRPTGAAIFAQSGTMASKALSYDYIDISYVFSIGNGAFLSIEDVMEYVIEEEEVNLLGIYLEGVKNPQKFIKCLARAYELKKPVVILVAGLSEAGKAATASHTGSMSSSRSVYEAVFKKYKVIMCENKDEFYSIMNVMLLLKDKLPTRANFVGFNYSGGENALLADGCEKNGVNLPQLEQGTVDKLRHILRSYVTIRNPLDVAGDFSLDTPKVLKILGDDPNIDCILFGTQAFQINNENINNQNGAHIMRYYFEMNNTKPIMIIPADEDRRDPVWRKKFAEVGVPILSNSANGFSVLNKFSEYVEDKTKKTLTSAIPDRVHIAPAVALSEYNSKQILADYGIPIPKQEIAKTKEKLLIILNDFQYPVVLKISSEDILHKTDAGGVKLNIKTKEEAVRAFDDIMINCAKYDPKARLDGVLVQEMVKPGMEMIIGISSDQKFGPMLMIGMGGVFVEIFKDIAIYPCPLNKEEAIEMLKNLKSYKLLTGYRGSKPLDINMLVDVMVKISEFAAKNKDTVKELDLNPVFVYPEGEGISVIDALLIRYTD